MVEILKILSSRVLVGLDGVVVLRVMVKRRVLLLKRRVHLLCDYVGAKDLTHEAVEELQDVAIVERLAGPVGVGVIVSTRCAVEAFSVSRRPDLVSRPSFCFSFLTSAHIRRVAAEVAVSGSPFHRPALISAFLTLKVPTSLPRSGRLLAIRGGLRWKGRSRGWNGGGTGFCCRAKVALMEVRV